MADVGFSAEEVIAMTVVLFEVSEELQKVGDVHLAFALDAVIRTLTDRLFGAD